MRKTASTFNDAIVAKSSAKMFVERKINGRKTVFRFLSGQTDPSKSKFNSLITPAKILDYKILKKTLFGFGVTLTIHQGKENLSNLLLHYFAKCKNF